MTPIQYTLTSHKILEKSYFAGWCFTHQYKNTTQFCFYAGLAATQNTNEKSRFIYEVSDYVADKNGILPITQKNGYRAVATNSHDPLYAALIYNYGFNAIPIDYITLNRAEAGTTIRIGVLYVKIN